MSNTDFPIILSTIKKIKDVLILLNNKGEIEYWGKSAEQMFGYSSKEVLGREFREILIPRSNHLNLQKAHTNLKLAGLDVGIDIAFELIVQKKDKTEFKVELILSLIEVKGLRFTIVCARDLNRRRKIEYEIIRLASFLEQIPVPIIEVDQATHEIYQNPATLSSFPDLEQMGLNHPLLKDFDTIIDDFEKDGKQGINRDVEYNHNHYREKIYSIPKSDLIRIFVSEIIERKPQEKIKKESQYIDELTKLYNRRGFEAILSQQIKFAERLKRGFILFVFHIRNLEAVVDVYGPREKKKIIVEFSSGLKDTFRKADISARLDHNHFAVIAVGAKKDTAQIIIDRVQNKLSFTNLDIRIGYVFYDPLDSCSSNELYSRARRSLDQ